MKVLVVEDNRVIAEELEKALLSWGFQCRVATDFKDILGEVSAYEPALILLDISLPFQNGYYWCAEIRKTSQIPIIFISSVSDDMNQVMALNMGGDDFIAKPFALEVVIAKTQALLRRSYEFSAAGEDIIQHRSITLTLGTMELSSHDTTIELSKNEFKILQLLLENEGKTVSREKMMEHLWNSDSFIDDNTLTVNINRLRKRLEQIGEGDLIITKRGAGYLIEKESL